MASSRVKTATVSTYVLSHSLLAYLHDADQEKPTTAFSAVVKAEKEEKAGKEVKVGGGTRTRS